MLGGMAEIKGVQGHLSYLPWGSIHEEGKGPRPSRRGHAGSPNFGLFFTPARYNTYDTNTVNLKQSSRNEFLSKF
jgi:hypothetical protein